MLKFGLTLAAAALPFTALAAAEPVDNYSATAIKVANYDRAIAQLEKRVLRAPNDEAALINLAVSYRHAGRMADADALYRRVLTLDDVELDSANGSAIMSREVARRALGRPLLVSAR